MLLCVAMLLIKIVLSVKHTVLCIYRLVFFCEKHSAIALSYGSHTFKHLRCQRLHS